MYVITPAVHGDARGYFMETYNENDMKKAGIDVHFVQDNHSMSTKGAVWSAFPTSDETEFSYKVNNFYHSNDERGMAWNNSEIGLA